MKNRDVLKRITAKLSFGSIISIFTIFCLIQTFQAIAANSNDGKPREVFRFVVGSEDNRLLLWGTQVEVEAHREGDPYLSDEVKLHLPKAFADAIRNAENQEDDGADPVIIIHIKGQSTIYCHWHPYRECHSD